MPPQPIIGFLQIHFYSYNSLPTSHITHRMKNLLCDNNISRTLPTLVAINLVIILSITLHKLISLNYFKELALSILGIRVIIVSFICIIFPGSAKISLISEQTDSAVYPIGIEKIKDGGHQVQGPSRDPWRIRPP